MLLDFDTKTQVGGYVEVYADVGPGLIHPIGQ